MAGAFLLASFAFTFNDLQDLEPDRLSEEKSDRPLVSGALSARSVQVLTASVAVVGIVLLGAGTPRFALYAGLSTIPVSVAYSFRAFSSKTVPGLSSLTHLIFGIQVFVMGAWSTGEPDWISFAVGAYFGLVFAAGHLHHEVADLEADRRSGVRTCAVRFGGRPVLLAGFSLWCLSAAYFSALALLRLVPAAWGWIQLGMFACYLVGFLIVLRRGTNARRLRRLQLVYRGAYLAGGLLMVASALLGE